MVITNLKVYYFEKKSLKRILHIDKIIGISKSLYKDKNLFCLHLNGDPEEELSSPHVNEIIYAIKHGYYKIVQKNLPIYGIVRPNS